MVPYAIDVLERGHIPRLCDCLGCAVFELYVPVLNLTPLKLTDLLRCDFSVVGKVGLKLKAPRTDKQSMEKKLTSPTSVKLEVYENMVTNL